MLRQAIAAVLLSAAFAAVSSAQVIYEPVQSQYRTAGGETFYYGGSNPRVFEYARQRVECFDRASFARVAPYGVGYLHRGLIGRPPQYTVSDCAPYRNAIVFGYTSVDARNTAYANVPRFFRMADLLAMAVPAPDGVGVVVPAQAPGTIVVRPVLPATRPATEPATQPKPVMIIPKKALEGAAEAGKILTDAR